MNLTKKKMTFVALTLIVVFLAGVIAGVQFAPKTVVVTVEEAISIKPESISVSINTGESGSANFTIHNIASVDIPLTVLAEVTDVVVNATLYPSDKYTPSPADLTLVYPQTLTATALIDTTLTIGFISATQIVPGTYTITVTTTRV